MTQSATQFKQARPATPTRGTVFTMPLKFGPNFTTLDELAAIRAQGGPKTAREQDLLAYQAAHSGSSRRFKAFRVATLGIIGVATGGAALTALGVIGPGAGVAVKGAAVATAASAPASAGLTVAAGLPAYAPQIAAAQSLTGVGIATAAPVAVKTSLSVAAKSAAAAVQGAAGLASSINAVRSIGMSPEAALPAYGPQIAAAQQPTTRSTVTALPGGGQDKNVVVALIALGLLALFV